AERNKRLRQRKKAAEIAVRHVTDSNDKSVPASRPPTTVAQINKAARYAAAAEMFSETKRIPSESRAALIAALEKLGSERAEERADAAVAVERERERLNLPWAELIVPAAAETELRVA